VGGATTGEVGFFLLVAMIFAVVVIPFFLGMSVRWWGWILGIAYASLYLFLLLPWYLWGEFGHNYMWTPTGFLPKHPPWIIIPVVAVGGVVSSLAGSTVPFSRLRNRFSPGRPLLTVIPILGVSLLVSALAPVAMHPMRERASVFACPEYGFRLTVPSGWYEIPSIYKGEKVYVVSSDDSVREQAIAEMEFDSTLGAPNGGGRLNVYVYDKMPFTGEPLSTFGSREEIYERLIMILEEVEKDPAHYLPKGMYQRIADLKYYGATKMGQTEAIRLAFVQYSDEPDGSKPNLPETSEYGDIIVYREPYLYWLETNADPPVYDEIKNSFQIKRTPPSLIRSASHLQKVACWADSINVDSM
jgi:hypothetical protein